VPSNDVKMVSVYVPKELGTPMTGRPVTNKDRTFGSSDHCRALLNYTTVDPLYPHELACNIDSS